VPPGDLEGDPRDLPRPPRRAQRPVDPADVLTEASMSKTKLATALHRLEDEGLVAAEWGVSELGRRAKFYRLTAAGREQLQAEIARVVAQLGELRDLIAEAHEDRTADEDERAAAFAMLDELGRSEARLAELHAILERAIDAAPADRKTVGVGSVVRVREDDGSEVVYTLVTAAEAAPASGRVSVHSPIGRALQGHHAGDEVTVEAPAGRWALQIVAIEEATPLAA
jgi:transcription elongation factor GreA